MSSNVNRVNTVHIGDGVNSAAAATLTLPTIAKGDLVLLDDKYQVIGTNADALNLGINATVYVAVGIASGEAIISSPIVGGMVSKVGSSKYAPALPQIDYIGFNGTGGSFTVNDESEYQLNIVTLDDQRVHGQKQTVERYNYTTDSDATQEELAFGIAFLFGQRKANGTNKTFNGRFVKLEVLTNGAFTASDNDVAVVQGSTRIVFNTAAEYGTGTPYAAGDLIRLGGTGATEAVYKIDSVSGTTVTLTTPYQGTSGTILAANSGNVAANGDFGFKITALTPVWNGIDTYEYMKFDVSMYDVKRSSSAPFTVTKAQKAYGGVGTYREVYDAEYFAQGYQGVNSRTEWWDKAFSRTPEFNADATKTYNVISVEFTGTERTDFQNTRTNPKSVQIYIPVVSTPPVDGEQAFNAGDEFVHIFNGFFGASGALKFDNVSFQ